MLPEGLSGSPLDAARWTCADGAHRGFVVERAGFCVKGLCKPARSCSATEVAAATRSWTCAGERQVFSRTPVDGNGSSTSFCRVEDKETSLQKIVFGVSVGVVLAIGVATMLWLARRHPAKVKKSAPSNIINEFNRIVLARHPTKVKRGPPL